MEEIDYQESQTEEAEVLCSIYESDENFKKISDQRFSFMFGDEGSPKSFLVHIIWTENYPDALPEFNLDAFYNNHLNSTQKKSIVDRLLLESQELIGSALTYTLFEWIKEHLDELIVVQESNQQESEGNKHESDQVKSTTTVKDKKEHLSKQQKRRLADRGFLNDERPRGWNWVDIIKKGSLQEA
ncbi:uncharacterized protein TRIADDRAFT_51492 [Trichoplax adhaerens]|uniref:RWD domain-containing protein n=1 Tax=Trichoplax adhaerens TaxID=10228 RepID=B3RJC8_TRIAD|nr:hypothetical protein TRIADDRAFT_51492 [Trichoplax adhaerens]EDV29309.1 hypothetical protein TRIADDRAFT_51492 [Trichoplax adhaerens]|eukprot:XP_002108511.1 hypothetical protein TRIADDRAFT_51492 [Trichoplax adhaerens]